jgi:type VI secretion system protein ImpL
MKMKAWLKNAKVISAAGFVILMLLIWFLGPLWGLESFDARMMWISIVIAVWMFTLLAAQLLSIRGARLFEKMFRGEADSAVVGAASERRAEVKLLRERLLAAIHTLKTSRLGKARGYAALYELPWYMIIGHPAAGKSTALLQSGLTFPFSDQYGAGVQGMGGTRNCDWFFSSEGVLLDTAGRYATETDGRDAWLGFLKLLKRYRSKAPVNGILVATSLSELLQYRSESFTVYARKIRERIHEVENIFGMCPPVYLIFTKLDLLGGFTQFFADTTEEERTRVWGATFSHEQESEFDVRRAVGEQCELLYRGLRQISEEKLELARGADAKPAYFAFPLEFHALKDGICRFVELLHEDDPYHARPLLRGIYFTSAEQKKGEPRIAAASRVSSQFELSRNGFDIQRPSGANAYFLRDLFREVLFADQSLVLRQTRPRVNRMRLASLVSGLAALTGAAGLLTLSYADNREMIADIEVERVGVIDAFAATDALSDRLAALARLQSRLEQLQQYRIEGIPWRIGMGLYQGQKLESALRKQYFDGLRAVMLEPVRGRLETVLEQWAQRRVVASEGTEGYNVLKTYLILGTRERLEAAWLAEQLPRAWRPWLEAQHISPDALENGDAGRVLRFYLSQLRAPDVPLIENNESLIDSSRKTLRHALAQQLPAGERIYAELKNRANAKFPSLTVDFILAGKDADILTGAAEVPGAFTREAWDKYMKNAIVEASRNGIESEDWVLSSATQDSPAQDGDATGKQSELEALYRADYAKAWMTFLRGLAVTEPGDLTRAERELARLSDTQGSPIRIILQRAAFETAWDNPSRLSNTVQTARQSVLDKTAGLLQGNNVRVPDMGQIAQNAQYGELGRQFAFLASLAGDNKQISPVMAGYLERLGRLKARFAKISAADEQGLEARELVEATLNGKDSELVDTLRYIDDVMFGPNDAAFREALRPLLAKPLFASYAALLPPVVEDINLLWESDVYDEWKVLAAQYPFSNARDEAELSEIASFIKSDGVLDAFVDNILGELVIRRGNQISARHWNGQGMRLEPSFVANAERLLSFSGVLKRGETARFELQPVPTPGLSEIKVEIDGQTLRYRNGPQPWQAFRWPAGEEQGARIQAVAFNGATATVSSQHGRMGLIRMLGESKRTYDPKTTRGQLVWRVQGLGEAGEIKLNFNMVSGLNPMQLSALRSVSLPRRIAQ